jgi:hypothetical protein
MSVKISLSKTSRLFRNVPIGVLHLFPLLPSLGKDYIYWCLLLSHGYNPLFQGYFLSISSNGIKH